MQLESTMHVEMTPELWRRVKAIVTGALDEPDAAREAYVARACAGDDALQKEVRSLIRATAMATTYLEAPAALSVARVFETGVRIGGWRLVHQLGQGGMGTVYLAERVEAGFNQRAAIKLVRGGFADDLLMQRFRDERQILATLEHPNIARLIDGGATADGLPYVVLEYVEGMPIDDYCDRHALDVRQRLELFRQVCGAVHYAHQRLVVHRDIKASNILVTADGTPKLLDFGIAKLVDPTLGRERTRTLLRIVTPESASPEQLRGEGVTTATDVYGLGVLLYRLLTGTSPYRLRTTTETELIQAVCEQVPDAPSVAARGLDGDRGRRLSATITRDLDHIVMKALRKEPERRYGTAEELGEDLRRYLTGLPVEATPDSRAYRTRKFIGRHRGAVAAACALVLALTAGVVATAWQARIAHRERNHAQREFNAVRNLANAVMGELHDAVVKLPGSTAASAILLKRATEYLDALASEAAGDADLRREVARGYRRLSLVQGSGGLQNVGDQQAAIASNRKAAALLEPLVSGVASDPRDRVALAGTYVEAAGWSTDAGARASYLQRAQTLLTDLPNIARTNSQTFAISSAAWFAISSDQRDGKDLAGARASLLNAIRDADEAIRLAPQNLDLNRNLSLYYKTLGAVNELLDRPAEALPLYEKALALDQGRVDHEPGRGLWKLDLSFSYGSLGALRSSEGDVQRAIEAYTKAVDLRRSVVVADPNDDFAKTSLARGYERMAGLLARSGDVSGSIGYLEKKSALFRERLDAHPERDAYWHDYARSTFDGILFALTLLESKETPRSARRAAAPRVRTMLADLAAYRARGRTLAPDDEAVARAWERVRILNR